MWIISIWHKMTPNDLHFLNVLSVLGGTGIHGPPWTGTDRSESVRDVQDFVGPGPVRYLENFSCSWSGSVPGFEIFLGPGLVRSRFWNFYSSWFGPRFRDSVRDQSVLVDGSVREMQVTDMDGFISDFIPEKCQIFEFRKKNP